MPEHRRRRATQRSGTTPIGPKGCGGMAPSSSCRLESGPMAHATDDAGDPGRTSTGRVRLLDGTWSTPRRANTAGCGASSAAVVTS
jgi:hypothetical protein